MRGSAALRAVVAPGGVLAGPWVRNELWRRARAVPSLDLRFAESKSLVDSVSGQNLITFTRASTGTFVDSDGVIRSAGNDVPRFDHNPLTGECLGLLPEEQRQNLLLNSATLSTQTVTVTAVAHTLSFYGTGTVTLSGTSTAGPLVGTGSNARVSLTFTPTAGSLTLTVSGSVTNANLEIGSFPTSWIPTTGTAATRTADVVSITGTNFSSWYRQDEGTVFARAVSITPITHGLIGVDDGTNNERLRLGHSGTSAASAVVVDNNIVQVNMATPTSLIPLGVQGSSAFAYKLNDFIVAASGALTATPDVSGTLPTVTQATIGTAQGNTYCNGPISRLTYWPHRIDDSTLQSITQ